MIFLSQRFSEVSQTKRSGFALVIALSLMAFVLVLVMTLTSLVRVETSLAKSQIDQLQAKQNARLAAFIALGDLQKTMGPDTRVSAQASILSGDNPDFATVANANTRYWSGVWDSTDWDPGDPADRQNRFQDWLVSLPDSLKGNIDAVGNGALVSLIDPANPNAVTLAKLRDDPADLSVETDVRVPLKTVEGIGELAWWVSDEGVKANPSLADPYVGLADIAEAEDGDFDPAIPQFLYPNRPNLSLTEWFENLNFDAGYAEEFNDRLRKIDSVGGSPWLAFMAAGSDLDSAVEAALQQDRIFADYSFQSYGVLSSTRRGGLRGDLSLAFWRDADTIFPIDRNVPDLNTPFENDFRFRRIFSPADYDDMSQNAPGNSSVGALNPYGARWEVLRDFHNSFQKITVDDDYEVVRAYTPGNPAVGSTGSGRSYHHFPRREQDAEQIRVGVADSLNRFGNSARNIDTNSDGRGIIWGAGSSQPVEHITSPVYPVLTRYILHFEGTLVENPRQDPADIIANGISYLPEIRMKMYMTFWNPYNIPISLARNDEVNSGFRGGGNSDGRPRYQISLFNYDLSNFEIVIDGESWRVGQAANNDPSNGDYVTLFPGTGINVRYPMQIADVRLPRMFSDDNLHPERLGGHPHDVSDYEAGEVRFFTFHQKLRDETGDSGASPGEVTPFFLSLDDVGYQAWQNTFRKQLGFYSDDNSGYKTGDVVSFRLNVRDPSETRGIDTVLNGWSSNSGNPQRPIQYLTTEIDFSVVPDSEPITAGDISLSTGLPVVADLGYIEFALKSGDSLNPGDYTSNMDFSVPRFTNFNPRGFAGTDVNTPYGEGQNPLYWFGTVRNGDPLVHVSTDRVSGPRDSNRYHQSYWGDDHTGPSGQSIMALFDVPRRPVESMGQYQHAMLSWLSNQPTYPFGNSLADIHVPRSGVIARYAQNGETRNYMDYSWLINDSLWDDYFLSTIDPYVDITTGTVTRYRPQRSRFVELDDTVSYNRGDSANPATAVDYSESAGNLLLRGAFNINSTSLEAWKAVISSLATDGVDFYESDSASTDQTGRLEYPFHRLSKPLAAPSSGDPTNEPWVGGPRELTESQIEDLAQSIVDQVRERGPFLSISDFVNRRIGPDADDRTMMGAIQAAIDEQSGLQDIVADTGDVDFSGSAPNYWNQNLPTSIRDKPLAFAPGDLTQADILTTIGPLLTARSDTFVIRSYGSVQGPSPSDTNAEAWCEMVVQRFPDAVNGTPADPLAVRNLRSELPEKRLQV